MCRGMVASLGVTSPGIYDLFSDWPLPCVHGKGDPVPRTRPGHFTPNLLCYTSTIETEHDRKAALAQPLGSRTVSTAVFLRSRGRSDAGYTFVLLTFRL